MQAHALSVKSILTLDIVMTAHYDDEHSLRIHRYLWHIVISSLWFANDVHIRIRLCERDKNAARTKACDEHFFLAHKTNGSFTP